jgi:multidrug efflux pump subunit AcrA (membrane-fusion protein)
VTVLELREIDPVKPLLLTGVVDSWKEEDVAFEVDGRVSFVVESGTILEGRWEEAGKVRAEGDVLAVMDDETYRIARDQAAASLSVAKEQLVVARVELEKVLPADLAAAKAERDRAQAEFVRYEKAREKEAVSELDVIRARADRDARLANYEQAQAAFDTKRAEIKSLEANVLRATEDLKRVAYDLERCTLRAPFPAEVSEVLVEAGGYVTRGKPVAHLVMMTPIELALAVSGETAAKLRLGDVVTLFPPGNAEPQPGKIYDKATVADPETRTLRISVITRNVRLGVTFPDDDPRYALPRVSQYLALMQIPELAGPFYVEANRALRRDGGGHYVWAAPSHVFLEPLPDDGVLELRKHYLEVGSRHINYQGLYLFREVTDPRGMKPYTVIALDVDEGFEDGGKVVVSPGDWLLRPGQLVPVLLSHEVPRPGLYLPMDALKPVDEQNAVVFLNQGGRAKETPVRILDRVGELIRVEGDGIAEGVEIITDHVHFLQDGEAVSVARRRTTGK